ncbi:MAG: minor capsid protein [Abditibacteriota bacterium]|nr:minor capsid protein [Abditibacteriota bacterium]
MYEYMDNVLKALQERYIALFEKLNTLPIDELNAIPPTKKLYDQLLKLVKKWYLLIAAHAYRDGWAAAEAKGKKKKEPDLEWLLFLLSEENPDPVTKYAFIPEAERKQGRLAEAISASRTQAERKEEIRKGMKYWTFQSTCGGVRVVDEATQKAYKDAGIKRVRWITQEDEKVCAVCHKRNMKIYPIDAIPPKPHPNCRCYTIPYRGGRR